MEKVRLLTPNVVLTLSTTGVTAADGADTDTGQQNILKFTVPAGEVIGVPRFAHIVTKCYTDHIATQLARYAEFSLGLITPSDPNRVVPIGAQQISYTPYYDLSLAQMRDDDFKERFIHELSRVTCPIIVFDQEETLVVQFRNVLLGVDVSHSIFELPIYRGRPGSITEELKWRRLELGR